MCHDDRGLHAPCGDLRSEPTRRAGPDPVRDPGRAGDTDRDKIRDALAATKNFAGVTGNITIDENRNAVKSAVMLQIKNGKPVYVSTVKP